MPTLVPFYPYFSIPLYEFEVIILYIFQMVKKDSTLVCIYSVAPLWCAKLSTLMIETQMGNKGCLGCNLRLI